MTIDPHITRASGNTRKQLVEKGVRAPIGCYLDAHPKEKVRLCSKKRPFRKVQMLRNQYGKPTFKGTRDTLLVNTDPVQSADLYYPPVP